MTEKETMKPGSLDTGTVNLSTGNVSFPVSLVSLPGRNGLNFTLSINYSSGGIRQIVDARTVEAPTGVLGLGWSFPQDKFVRASNGLLQDATYALFSGNTVYPFLRTGVDEEGEIYESENYQFWKIRYVSARELWVVTKEDGTRSFYGGGVLPSEEHMKTSSGNSIEWGVRWGNWIGPSNVAAGQEQFPVAWNLARIEDIWGERITITYEQDQQFVGTAGNTRKKYTQACRLSQVIGATGEKVVLHYGPESGKENPYEKRQKRYTLPGGGPDAYQSRLEPHFLDSLSVFNAQGDLLSRVQLRYASLGSGDDQRQILKAITHLSSGGRPYAPGQLFTYYGESSADGVSVSRTDTSKIAREGALFGALKSVISSKGATTSYQYAEISLPHAQRDLAIPRPSSEWLQPRTYVGLDYAVMIWRGTGSKLGKLHVSAYQWSGRWIPAVGLAEVTIHDAKGIVLAGDNLVLDDRIQVELSTDSFAIVTPGQEQALHLFSKNHLKSGTWIYTPQNTGSISDFLLASGSNFFVLLDKSNGRLHCFTQEGEDWRSDPVFEQPLKTGVDTLFSLVARNNYLCTISAVPNHAFQPELRLYSLDPARTWRAPIVHQNAHFFESSPGGSTTLKKLDLQSGTTFVSLLVTASVSIANNTVNRDYRHFVYRWTETTFAVEELEQFFSSYVLTIPEILRGVDRPEAQLLVAGDMMTVIVPVDKLKVVYQYTGERWLSRKFFNDSEKNNYLGYNSFSTTENGWARFWEFNPNTSQWEDGKVPAYKDGNPTIFSKFWSEIWPSISFLVGILTLPVNFGIGFMLGLALLPFDLFSMMRPPEEGGAGQGGEQFFTGDNQVYHREPDGTWQKIGELVSEEAQRYRPVLSSTGEQFLEQQRLEYQNTQAASNFIAYGITWIRQTSRPGDRTQQGEPTYVVSDVPGFPKYLSHVQLLKNGAFLSSARELAEGESLKKSPDDETGLVGWNTFLTFQGGATLKDATSLKLYRVIQDDFQGPLKDYVVSQVTVHDGYEETHTHYAYEATSAELLPTATTAIYNQVTTIYSGAAKTPDKGNGYTESYFYLGDALSLRFQPSDSTNASQYPALIKGFPYSTMVYNGKGRLVATTTQSWSVFQKTLVRQARGYYVHLLKNVSSTVDGSTKVVEQTYNHQDELGNAFPDKTITYNYDLLGREEKLETSSTYGWRVYPQLRERHILTAVVESAARVNTVVTGASATNWQAIPLAPFRLTPGRDFPPALQGDRWSVTALETISARDQRPFPPGTSEQPWKADISPLILTTNLSGTLLFTYDCNVAVSNGWTWMQLEVWVDGQKVWGVEKNLGNRSTASETVTIALPSRHGPVEWRVNCGAHVPANETGHLVNYAEAMVSIRDIRFLLLAPVETYRAKNALAIVGDPAYTIVMGEQNVETPTSAQQEAEAAWLKTATIVARNPTYGVVTETRDIDGVIHSILYDKNYRFPIANFIHASVEGHEAGYYGFEDDENEALWQVTGTPAADDASHTGRKALSGRDVRIEPRAFLPRASATPSIISAWVKLRSEGSGGRIGFGKDSKQLSPGKGDWQYVEYVTNSPLADQKPFISCDGAIDDVRFGPVDAPFSATVYDPIYHLATAQLGTNGETVRFLYDDLQHLIATTSSDGNSVISLMIEKDSRDGEKPFNGDQPNQRLALLPRNGGQYYRTLPTPSFTGEAFEQQFYPTTAAYGLTLKVFSPVPALVDNENVPASPWFGIRFGDANVVRTDESSMSLTRRDQPVKHFTAEYNPLARVEWTLIVLEDKALFFLDGKLVFCEPIKHSAGDPLSVLWGPDERAVSLTDIFILSDPSVVLAYSDGLGRLIQTQRLDDRANGIVTRQILYDGWGHPAVTTKPLQDQITFAYQRDLVKTFDWNSGKMTGKVVDYYGQTSVQAPGQKADDAFYAYSRQMAEASPLARIIEAGSPGVEFKVGSPLAVQMEYGWSVQKDGFLLDLNLGGKSSRYTVVTTRSPFDQQTRSVSLQLFDLQGRLIAQKQSSQAGSLTSTLHVAYEADGTQSLTGKEPNTYYTPQNDRYLATAKTDFLGRTLVATDCDSSTEHDIYDLAGRLRFKLDANGAAENPNQIAYWKYDALGRVVEEGLVSQPWDQEQFQRYADTQAFWPQAPISTAGWKRRYVYDLAPNNETANLKGRLYEVRTRDEEGKEIIEAFEYDLAGNVVSTQLVTEAFDSRTRVTRYAYDKHGSVTGIIYPYDLSDKPGFEVHYFYNIAGQLASIGTADDPTRYAAYDYNIDGSLKTERVNKQHLQRDYRYDFQGHLLAIQDPNGLFSEELGYQDAEGHFKDGNIAQATIVGSTPGSSYAYSYQYNEHRQLISAKTIAVEAGMVPHPDWDVAGPDGSAVQYDPNGNMTHIKQGPVSSTYLYKPGSNQLHLLRRDPARRQTFGFEAEELEHFHTEPTMPMQFGDWYCKETTGGRITSVEKHSGMQSHQLGSVLFSIIAPTPVSKGYIFTGWIKNAEPGQEIAVCIQRDLSGPSLVEQIIGNTGGDWKKFECVLPDAGSTPQLIAYIHPRNVARTPQAVYVDDVSFGPLIEEEEYQYNPNGALVKSGELDAVHYEPLSGLPLAIHRGNQVTQFRYGGRRQRVLKTTTPDGQSTVQQEQRLYVHGTNAYPLVEKTQSGETIYIYGPGGSLALLENGEASFFLLKDHLGSTRVVVNQENQPIATFDYLPFGGFSPGNSNQPEAIRRFRYLYTGQEYDGETGLYNYRARMYDPNLGRFLSLDAVREFFSPYLYVGNNPINLVDPTGLISLGGLRALFGFTYTVAHAGIGTLLGAAAGAALGAVLGNTAAGAKWGAAGGALLGASWGVARSVGEFVIEPLAREAKAVAAAARGGTFPVIAYNEFQVTDLLASGRAGAEMIAEAQGIPRSLWDQHLVSFQELDAAARQAPRTFNGNIIATAHGIPGLNGSVASVEVGLAGQANFDGYDFFALFRRLPGDAYRNRAVAHPGWDFSPNIKRIDLNVCSPRPHFTSHLRASINLNDPQIQGWGSSKITTPLGAGTSMGVIRETGKWYEEAVHWLTGMPAGTPMPAVGDPAAGGWVAY